MFDLIQVIDLKILDFVYLFFFFNLFSSSIVTFDQVHMSSMILLS